MLPASLHGWIRETVSPQSYRNFPVPHTMHLVLRTVSRLPESATPSIMGRFDERGGTIGRSDSNTLTLPDPERHVSRLQADIRFAAGVFSLRNVGGTNVIHVNGQALMPGDELPLRHQDQVAIANYVLQVELQSQPAVPADLLAGQLAEQLAGQLADPRTVIGASAGEQRTTPSCRQRPGTTADPREPDWADDPFADLLGAPPALAAPGTDPYADLLGVAAGPSVLPPSHSPSAPNVRPSAAPRLPDDFDPFAELVAPVLGAPDVLPAHDLSGLPGVGALEPSLDAAFGLHAASGHSDALAAFLAPSPGDVADAPAGAPDPFAFLDAGRPAAEPVGPAVADHTPAWEAAFVPPPLLPPTAPAPALASAASGPPDVAVPRVEPGARSPAEAPNAVAPPPPSFAELDALCQAFREGAGLPQQAPLHLTPDLMRTLGATLRQAVEGTLQLSSARTTVKQELRVAVTVIRPKGNNPLKFAPDASAALAQMLQPPMRGFMAAPEAMQEVMSDLLGHAVGTMEGTRAALQGMLHRFEPAQLEGQLASGGLLDRLLPMNRRAQLWALYQQHHGRITEAAREDFDALFGKAFAQAYEAHADRVAAARRAAH